MGTATETALPPTADKKTRMRLNRKLKPAGMKCCNRCLVVKSVSQFGTHKRDGYQSACKACQSAEGAKYNAEHREARREYYAKYRAENREARREYNARWYAENREERREYAAKWYAANCEEQREYKANRRAANSTRPLDIGDGHLEKTCTTVTNGGCERILTRGDFHRKRSELDQRHPLCRDCKARRRANSGYRKACRQAHGEPEATVCHLCGLPNDADAWVDHLHPQSRADEYAGDIHEPSNLRWAHAACNISRGNKPLTSIQLSRIYGEAA